MGAACASCGGVAFGHIEPGAGYLDTGRPCPSCNADAEPREPGSFAPKPAVNKTHQFVDGPPDHPIDPNDSGEPAEAFFTADQIAQQRAVDAVREAGMGRDG